MQENIFKDDFFDGTPLKFILVVEHKGSGIVIIFHLVMLPASEFFKQEVGITFWGRRGAKQEHFATSN